jgi:hypothetical protein
MEAHLEPQAAQQGCEGIHQQEAIALMRHNQWISTDRFGSENRKQGAPFVSIEIENPLNIDNIGGSVWSRSWDCAKTTVASSASSAWEMGV